MESIVIRIANVGRATMMPDTANAMIDLSTTILYMINGIHPMGDVDLIIKDTTIIAVKIATSLLNFCLIPK